MTLRHTPEILFGMRSLLVLGVALCSLACSSSNDATGTPSPGAGGSSGGAGGAGGAAAGSSGSSSGSGGSAAGASGSSAGSGSHTNPLTQDVIDEFVAAHNAARAAPHTPAPSPALPPVTWDAVLADSAYNYLSKCVANGPLVAHNANRTSDYQALGGNDYVGENIFASTANTVHPQDALDSWMSEESAYDYTQNNITDAGHYTQVVWRDSVRIGCAIVDCPSIMYDNTILCDYAPGGNDTGKKPY